MATKTTKIRVCTLPDFKITELLQNGTKVCNESETLECRIVKDMKDDFIFGIDNLGNRWNLDEMFFIIENPIDGNKPKDFDELVSIWRENNEFCYKHHQFSLRGGSDYKESFETYGKLIELWKHWVAHNDKETLAQQYFYRIVWDSDCHYFSIREVVSPNNIFTFKTKELAEEFYSTFKKDLESIKPILI